LVVKPNGVGVSRTQDWWAIVSLETLTQLIKDSERAKGLQP